MAQSDSSDDRQFPIGAVLEAKPKSSPEVESKEEKPDERLRDWIQSIWLFRWNLCEGEEILVEAMPNNCPSVILQRKTDEKWTGSKLVGPIKSLYRYAIRGAGGMIGVRFEPGALFDFIGKPLSMLVDTVDGIELVFGEHATEIVNKVLSLSDFEEQVALLNKRLLERCPPRMSAQARRVKKLCRHISDDVSLVRVDDLIRISRMSERSLQRLFSKYVGVSPKHAIRVIRFQETLQTMKRGDSIDWVQLAVGLGYFDQSHFINDFRDMTGCAPADFVLRKSV